MSDEVVDPVIAAFEAGGLEAVAAVPDSVRQDAAVTAAAELAILTRTPRFRVLTVDQLEEEPDLEWFVDGIMPRGGFGIAFGGTGSGKTFTVLDVCMKIASGRGRFFGREVRKGRVVYVAAEGRLKERVQAYRREHPRDRLDDFRVVAAAPDLASPEDASALTLDLLQAIGERFDLLVLDTWTDVTPRSEENSRTDMSAALSVCRGIAGRFGASLLVIHHIGSNSEKAETPRGSSALLASADYAWRISKNKQGARSLHCAKMRDAEPFPSYDFRLRAVAPSCVVDCGEESVDQSDDVPLSDSQIRALVALAGRSEPLGNADWARATGLPPRTFQRVRGELVALGKVAKSGSGYSLTDETDQCQAVPTSATWHSGTGSKAVPTSATLLKSGTSGTDPHLSEAA